MNQVLLVDEQDKALRYEEKVIAHELCLLHRAFSIFIFRIESQKLELLVQQRAYTKYHSGGLWSNTCCGHPLEDKSIEESANDRLYEEMGIRAHLKYLGWFCYQVPVAAHMYEHENDHVFVGILSSYKCKIRSNLEEVIDFKWIEWSQVLETLTAVTPWFKPAVQHLLTTINQTDLLNLIQTMQIQKSNL